MTWLDRLEGRLLLASTNPHKVEEIRRILDLPGIDYLALSDFPPMLAPEEHGLTYQANAAIKAGAYLAFTGVPTLAEDAGLEIDGLKGILGVHSARFMGEDVPYSLRNAAVLESMQGLPPEQRGARYVSAMCLAFPDGSMLEHSATCEGRIGASACGTQGFGYDPIFLIPDLGLTFGQLSAQEKDARSHRSRCLQGLRHLLLG